MAIHLFKQLSLLLFLISLSLKSSALDIYLSKNTSIVTVGSTAVHISSTKIGAVEKANGRAKLVTKGFFGQIYELSGVYFDVMESGTIVSVFVCFKPESVSMDIVPGDEREQSLTKVFTGKVWCDGLELRQGVASGQIKMRVKEFESAIENDEKFGGETTFSIPGKNVYQAFYGTNIISYDLQNDEPAKLMVSKGNRSDIAVHTAAARKLIDAGDSQRAVSMIKEMMSGQGVQSPFYIYCAELQATELLKLNKSLEALNLLNKIFTIEALNEVKNIRYTEENCSTYSCFLVHALRVRAFVHYNFQQHADALRDADLAFSSFPDHMLAQVAVNSAFQEKNYQKAIFYGNWLIKNYKENNCYVIVAYSAFNSGDYSAAINAFSKAIQFEPNAKIRAEYYYGRAYATALQSENNNALNTEAKKLICEDLVLARRNGLATSDLDKLSSKYCP
ncbi:hypothetical protein EOD41_04390 [Mucilaginibacter limnophilus]|uniref:Uncharacterized protein n=1 Tax=Mucilaginibacter limnophilus TaxID=1932778 RepID=A0A3S2VN12_9SPHI|nr:hypothetical protein [Mucilaginibacter limnophilus]RVU01211.1 hypothetical protein EOD41_04390 [Mucilaginibacter limnophilus]